MGVITNYTKVSDIKPIPYSDELHCWEKQEKEKEEHYTLFRGYLMMDKDERSVNRFIKKVMPTLPVKKAPKTISFLVYKNRWHERVAAYEIFNAKLERKEREKELKAMAKRHATIANNALGALSQPVEEFIRRLRDGKLDLTKLSDTALMNIIIKMSTSIEKIVAVERLSRGAPATIEGQIIGTGINENGDITGTFADMIESHFRKAKEVKQLEKESIETIQDAQLIDE